MKRNAGLYKCSLATVLCFLCWLTAKSQSALSDAQGVGQKLRGTYSTGKVLVIPEEGYLHLLLSDNGAEVKHAIYIIQPKDFTGKERKILEKAEVLNLGSVVVINSPESGFRYIFRVGNEQATKAFGKLPADYFSAATVVDAVGIGADPATGLGAVRPLAIPVENFKPGIAVFTVMYKREMPNQ